MKAPKGLLVGALSSLVAAAAFMGMNLFQLGSVSDWDWLYIERYFLTTEAVQFSGGRAGRSEMWRFLFVWGPMVLIPLAIVLLILHFAMKGSKGAKLFADFQQRGWVGRQRSLGLSAINGNRPAPLALIGPAAAPDGYVDQPALQFGSWMATLDKKTIKKLSAGATKANAIKGTPAPLVHENLPGDMIVAAEQKGGELVAVIPPATGTKGYKVLMIKGQEN